MPKLFVKKLSIDALVPTRNNATDAGYDLYSKEDKKIKPWNRCLIGTGIAVSIPEFCYGRIAARSGLSVNNNIDVGAGVVDCGYRGELKVCLINSSDSEFCVRKGMKIAQLICEKVVYPEIICVEDLNETPRGNNGFGSSGI